MLPFLFNFGAIRVECCEASPTPNSRQLCPNQEATRAECSLNPELEHGQRCCTRFIALSNVSSEGPGPRRISCLATSSSAVLLASQSLMVDISHADHRKSIVTAPPKTAVTATNRILLHARQNGAIRWPSVTGLPRHLHAFGRLRLLGWSCKVGRGRRRPPLCQLGDTMIAHKIVWKDRSCLFKLKSCR